MLFSDAISNIEPDAIENSGRTHTYTEYWECRQYIESDPIYGDFPILVIIDAHHHIVIMIEAKCMPGGPKRAGNQKLVWEEKHTR